MIPVKDTDHVTEARALVIDQFNGRAVIQGILDSWVNRLQALENALFDVINSRLLDNATHAQLDSIGDLVHEAREGRDDTSYREAVRLRIRINRSKGRAEDVIQVVNLSTAGNFEYEEVYPAGFYVYAFNLPAPRVLQKSIGQTRSVGTAGILVSSNWPSADNLVLDSVYGGVTSANGVGSVYDGSIVAKLTSAQESKP